MTDVPGDGRERAVAAAQDEDNQEAEVGGGVAARALGPVAADRLREMAEVAVSASAAR